MSVDESLMEAHRALLVETVRTDAGFRQELYEAFFAEASEADLAGLVDLVIRSRPVAWLLAHAINELWGQESCDPGQCAPCAAIMAMRPISSSMLAEVGPGSEWWDDAAGDVAWDELTARWTGREEE